MKRSRPDRTSARDRSQLEFAFEDAFAEAGALSAKSRGAGAPAAPPQGLTDWMNRLLGRGPASPPSPPRAPSPTPGQPTLAPGTADGAGVAGGLVVVPAHSTSAPPAASTPPLPPPPPLPTSVAARSQEVIYRRNDRARRYILRVDRRGVVTVTIPRRGSLEAAQKFVASRADWIQRQQARRAHLRKAEDDRKSSRMVLLRGQDTAWAVEPAPRGFCVVLTGGGAVPRPASAAAGKAAAPATTTLDAAVERMEVRCAGTRRASAPGPATASPSATAASTSPAPAQPAPRQVLMAALRALAEHELPPRTHALAHEHGIRISRVTVRAQRSRWGSCSADGAISLNWRLIHAPPAVRDYLIIHELMHRRQMNHSARYWREVAAACPDYEEAEKWLDQHSYLLDNSEPAGE